MRKRTTPTKEPVVLRLECNAPAFSLLRSIRLSRHYAREQEASCPDTSRTEETSSMLDAVITTRLAGFYKTN